MSTLLIRAARVINPAANFDEHADIALIDGVVSEVRSIKKSVRLSATPADLVIEADGLIATPGLIDPHVHLREPGAEDAETIESGSASAVAGGFTSVCCMPNTTPALDDDAMVEFIYTRAEQTAHCRVYPVGAATKGRKGEELAQITLMARDGAVGFSDDGDAIASPGLMLKALTYIQPTGLAFMQHCQEPSLTRGASMHSGSISTRLGLTGWPRIAEELIIERDIRLMKALGGATPRYHVQHISAGGSVDLVRRARKEGLPVSAEASPHHITLTHECVDLGHPAVLSAMHSKVSSYSPDFPTPAHAAATPSPGAGFSHPDASHPGGRYWTLAKMNPPLRESSDLNAILDGIADGTISILATDHAPHPHERKAVEFENAAFGILGLETALSLYIKALIEPGVVDWMRLIAMLTINPAKLCNLDRAALAAMGVPRHDPEDRSSRAARPTQGLGTLIAGAPADITLIDPHLEWTVSAQDMRSKSRNTPYDGARLRGRAVGTIVAGQIRYSLLESTRSIKPSSVALA